MILSTVILVTMGTPIYALPRFMNEDLVRSTTRADRRDIRPGLRWGAEQGQIDARLHAGAMLGARAFHAWRFGGHTMGSIGIGATWHWRRWMAFDLEFGWTAITRPAAVRSFGMLSAGHVSFRIPGISVSPFAKVGVFGGGRLSPKDPHYGTFGPSAGLGIDAYLGERVGISVEGFASGGAYRHLGQPTMGFVGGLRAGFVFSFGRFHQSPDRIMSTLYDPDADDDGAPDADPICRELACADEPPWMDYEGPSLVTSRDPEASDIDGPPTTAPDASGSPEMAGPSLYDAAASSKVLFAFGKAEMLDGWTNAVEVVAHYMKTENSCKLIVHAFGDRIGSPEATEILAQRRAEVVMNELAKRGVPMERMAAKGGGVLTRFRKPHENRRAEFMLTWCGLSVGHSHQR